MADKIDKKFFQEFRAKLVNQSALEPTDALYVSNLHGDPDAGEDVIARLFDDIEITEGSGLYYFTGQRGTGKSTELKRLRQSLAANAGYQPILFDSLEFISESQPINLEEIWLLLVVGLAQWIEQEYKKDFLDSDLSQRFMNWLKSEVKIEEVSYHGVKVKIKEQQEQVAEKVKAWRAKGEWITQITKTGAEMVQFVKDRARKTKVVVIVDSLERLRGASLPDQDEMFHRVVGIFGGDIHKLRLPGAHVVYSVPPYLPLLTSVRDLVRCYALASVRVFEKPNGTQRQPRDSALARMESLINKRYQAWNTILSPAAVRELAMMSGGDLRHFMYRLVNDAVSQAMYAQDRLPLQAGDPIINTVIDNHRVQTEQLTRTDEWPMLKNITQTHRANVASKELAVLARLFEVRAVLNYKNGEEWFDVHPLLWRLIDAYTPPAAATATA